ncbi:large subunit ribosomal protein L7/L12 [Solirubrobacter pauli]|uniref:Large subunit ribosomal protein L7/L12 n=1 Tax=Solirubrobacter pauli TaxID=166793 RepID=A0A660KZW9_9ACTN|nr:ribosomal protein L7/L12 [Solirubrobacter pauli]RKQ86504.1 large subunit ribosomal protein L7/L12 [Solirubrobacter pauli]
MLTLVDLGPRPDEAVAAIAMVMDVGPRRAAELVEALPAALGLHPALAPVLREELERVGAVVEDREPPPGPVVPISTPTGDASVTLLDPGADRLRVTKAIAAGTGLTLREAKHLVETAPGVVASGLKPDAAAALRERLEAAGARVAP